MTRQIAIDIIICTYNNAQSLERTLDSLARQHSKPEIDWSVLIVDNNCTDDTVSVVQRAAERAVISVAIEREPEQGLTSARLHGVKSTTREWIAFIDDDCVLAPDWLVQTAAFATAHPSCGAFGGRIELSWETEPPSYVHRFRFAYAGKNHGSKVHRRGWLAGLGMTVRRAALVATGWTEQPLLADRIGDTLVSGGDMEIGLRIAVRHEIWYNPACGITHMIPPRRITREYLRRMMFGLGASRHNVAALTWHRRYVSFVMMELVMAAGLFARGCLDGAIEIARKGDRAGFRVTSSPAFGWVAAMNAMRKMPTSQRNALLGAATRRARD